MTPSPKRTAVVEIDNDEESHQGSQWDESSASDNSDDGEDGDGTVTSEYTRDSLDTVGRVLHRLEENDSSLVDLDIDCKAFDAEDAKNISLILPENTRLTRLRIYCGTNSRINTSSVSDNAANAKHVGICRRVLTGLRGSSSIEHVEIHDIILDRDTATWMAPSVLSNGKSLTRLTLTNCRFVGSGLAILFIAMQHNRHIRHLSFHSCFWEDHNAEIVASALPFLKLHSLALCDINIHVDSWPYLFKNIKRSKELLLLDLSRNKLDESIIGQLTKTMILQKNISTLVLTSCGIDDNCNKELANGLRKYSPLSTIDLSKNKEITDKGIVYLKDLLKFNTSITELKVNGCGLGGRSLDAIESSLRYNNSVFKGFLSESASQTIFGVVDMIEEINIGAALSFGYGESTSRRKDTSTFGSPPEPRRTSSYQSSSKATSRSPPRRMASLHQETTPRREPRCPAQREEVVTPRREGATPNNMSPPPSQYPHSNNNEGSSATAAAASGRSTTSPGGKVVNVDEIYGVKRILQNEKRIMLRGTSAPRNLRSGSGIKQQVIPSTQVQSPGSREETNSNNTGSTTSGGKEGGSVRYTMNPNDVYL